MLPLSYGPRPFHVVVILSTEQRFACPLSVKSVRLLLGAKFLMMSLVSAPGEAINGGFFVKSLVILMQKN